LFVEKVVKLLLSTLARGVRHAQVLSLRTPAALRNDRSDSLAQTDVRCLQLNSLTRHTHVS
jgi:hypothetical protein